MDSNNPTGSSGSFVDNAGAAIEKQVIISHADTVQIGIPLFGPDRSLDYRPILQNYQGGFRRGWLTEAVQQFLGDVGSRKNGPRYLRLVAPPFFGKTQFIAMFLRDSVVTPAPVCHFFRRGAGREFDDLAAFESSIVAQLRHRHGITDLKYRDLVPVLWEASRLASGQTQLIILDGLDEAVGPLARHGPLQRLLEVLPQSDYLPHGICFLVTTRPLLPAGWLDDPAECVSIPLPSSEALEREVTGFLREQNKSRNAPLPNAFLDQLVEASEGSLGLAARFLESPVETLEEWQAHENRIPRGFAGQLQRWWNDLLAASASKGIAPAILREVLGLLALAPEPLSIIQLIRLLDAARAQALSFTDQCDSFSVPGFSRDQTAEVIRLAQEFLSLGEGGELERSASFSHTSFEEFLLGQFPDAGMPLIPDEINNLRRTLIAGSQRCWREAENLARPFALRSLPVLLLESGDDVALCDLCRSREFLDAQETVSLGLPRSTLMIALQTAAKTDDAALLAEFGVAHAIRTQNLRQRSPWDSYLAGRLDEALGIIAVADPESQVLWHLMLVDDLRRKDREKEARRIFAHLNKLPHPLLHGGLETQAARLIVQAGWLGGKQLDELAARCVGESALQSARNRALPAASTRSLRSIPDNQKVVAVLAAPKDWEPTEVREMLPRILDADVGSCGLHSIIALVRLAANWTSGEGCAVLAWTLRRLKAEEYKYSSWIYDDLIIAVETWSHEAQQQAVPALCELAHLSLDNESNFNFVLKLVNIIYVWDSDLAEDLAGECFDVVADQSRTDRFNSIGTLLDRLNAKAILPHIEQVIWIAMSLDSDWERNLFLAKVIDALGRTDDSSAKHALERLIARFPLVDDRCYRVGLLARLASALSRWDVERAKAFLSDAIDLAYEIPQEGEPWKSRARAHAIRDIAEAVGQWFSSGKMIVLETVLRASASIGWTCNHADCLRYLAPLSRGGDVESRNVFAAIMASLKEVPLADLRINPLIALFEASNTWSRDAAASEIPKLLALSRPDYRLSNAYMFIGHVLHLVMAWDRVDVMKVLPDLLNAVEELCIEDDQAEALAKLVQAIAKWSPAEVEPICARALKIAKGMNSVAGRVLVFGQLGDVTPDNPGRIMALLAEALTARRPNPFGLERACSLAELAATVTSNTSTPSGLLSRFGCNLDRLWNSLRRPWGQTKGAFVGEWQIVEAEETILQLVTWVNEHVADELWRSSLLERMTASLAGWKRRDAQKLTTEFAHSAARFHETGLRAGLLLHLAKVVSASNRPEAEELLNQAVRISDDVFATEIRTDPHRWRAQILRQAASLAYGWEPGCGLKLLSAALEEIQQDEVVPEIRTRR